MKILLNHPKDGYKIDLNHLLDLTKYFKKRDTENWDRDYCVYVFLDDTEKIQYIGMGRYWNNKKWIRSRPFSHKKDMLSNTINERWTCRILGMGMTNIEAHCLEAYLIKNANRTLSKIGSYNWDGFSLINKKREKKWERIMCDWIWK